MTQVQRFFRRYVFTSIGIFLLFLVANILIIGGFFLASYLAGAADSRFPMQEFSDDIQSVDGKVESGTKVRAILEQENAWAMLLDEHGTVIWEELLPASLARSYTATDIAKFSRWYLEKYAVNIWKRADGLLMVGFAPNSVVQLYSSIERNYLQLLFSGIACAVFINMFLIIMLFIRNTRRVEKAITPILTGIHSLSQGQAFHLEENGELAEINAELNHAGNHLQKKDNTRAEWIRGVSHDIRTPLSLILGYSSEIEDDTTLPDTTRNQAGAIRHQSERLRNLVTDLNLTTKLEYSMDSITIAAVHPVELVRQVISKFINEGISAQYEFAMDEESTDNAALLYGDPALLSRMLRNLIHNSIVHNPAGCKILVAVSATTDDCTFIVTDYGVGIDDTYIKMLNKSQIIPTTQNDSDGSEHGLGLKIVKQIVKVHQGEISFCSMVPHGLCVKIILPVSDNQKSY